VRAVDGPLPDPRLDALETAAVLVEQTDVAHLLEVLSAEAQRDFAADWAAVVAPVDGTVLVSTGEPPEPVWLAAFMTLALACFVLAERHPAHRRRYLLLMYVAIGLGVLTKGPVAIAIPAVAALVWLITERRLGDLRRLMIPAGAVVVLAIVLPWYAAIYAQHGWEYIRFFFIDENLGRYANPLTTERSPLFFLVALLGDLALPWAPLIVVALAAMWRRRRRGVESGDSLRRLLWWYVGTTLAVFSFSASKEDLYILPAIPAAVVLIADVVIAEGDGFLRRGLQWTLAAIAVVAIALAVLVALFLTTGHYQLRGAWVLAVILALTGIATIAATLRGRPAAAVVALAAGFVLFDYVFVIATLPDVERLKPVPVLARTLQDRAAPAAPLATLSVDLPSLVYYANRPVERMWSVEDAARFVSDQKEAWMIAGEGDWPELRRLAPQACVATRTPLFLAKGSDIVRGQAPGDVLLITNKCQ
jgi:4-amino-4-deoxy-L-arabinose transferase-like glycosyltransferase